MGFECRDLVDSFEVTDLVIANFSKVLLGAGFGFHCVPTEAGRAWRVSKDSRRYRRSEESRLLDIVKRHAGPWWSLDPLIQDLRVSAQTAHAK